MNKLIALSGFLIVLFILNACTEKSYEELNKLLQDEWEITLKEYPQFATSYGDHRYDDKLSDVFYIEEVPLMVWNNLGDDIPHLQLHTQNNVLDINVVSFVYLGK